MFGCHYCCSSLGSLKLLTGGWSQLPVSPLSLSAGCFWQLSCNPSESCQPIHQCYKHNTRRGAQLTSPAEMVNTIINIQHKMHRKDINQGRTMKSVKEDSLSNTVCFMLTLHQDIYMKENCSTKTLSNISSR